MTASSLPVIDISGLASSDHARQQALADDIGRACDEIGFFYVTGHGIPDETIRAAVEAAARFFSLPLEEKLRIRAGASNRGYTPMRESEHEEGKPDINEGFELGYPIPADDPDFANPNPVRAPNRWPKLGDFRTPVEAYYASAFDLGMTVLRGFALHFGLPESFFIERFRRPVADMRLAHYPPQSGGALEYGTFEHTDHGIITVLWQDRNGGLEVFTRDGNWIAVPPVPGSFVVNSGDLMAHWTNGRFRSTLHRVVNLSGRDRYSIPFFFNPDFDTVIDPRDIPGLPVDIEPRTPVISGPFLLGRFSDYRASWKDPV